MQWFVIIPAVLLLLFLLVLVTKISITIMAGYTPQEQRVFVRVRILFFRYTINVLELMEKKKATSEQEPIQSEDDSPSFSTWAERLPELIKSAGDIHTMIKGFLRSVRIKKFLWRSYIGTGDAAYTGVIAGGLWSVKGMILGTLSTYMKIVKAPELEVVPVFQGEIATSQLECTITFRIGKALLTAVKLFRYIRKKKPVFTGHDADVRG
ncbi:DUF2953 domain-containing protein [Ectobacillus sp. JY-23]|uniref:DUF2953 domain-containing protein n=1 Tax=Ectobacillus sp. JY-23 TaxID=2933872 RepID=UPI001FF13B78|nr:DUF2953 domain-containing protein [Ectobacillus sp. JY-23]UOY94305.1 DUF2953 domain-containing protein [Ectobacillus sp. JY-23]